MKLKNILLTAVMALFTVSAYAASADELKVYINPGHGSWGGASNRHMATIGHSPISDTDPDTTDFFESNTNLVKCLELFHRLVDYGLKNDNRYGLDFTQNVVMSRIKNGPYPYDPNDKTTDTGNDYNRVLSEIATEAETWGADMFISVHSNAYTDGTNTNYLYFCLDGYADASGDKIATSKAMSLCGWNHRILDRHTMWTSYDYTMTAADLAAGKGKIAQQKLGVLNHDIPGYLVEGYFHTYQPARHKAMNFDVDRIEGLTYARGVADYYGLTKETTGDIYGVVRDLHEKFSHELYTPNTATFDKYKPLNGVNVTLWQGETQVATYVTDVNYNGAFVFKDLTPGDYTLTFSFEGYKEGMVWATDDSETSTASIAVTVKAAEVAYPTAFLESLTWTPPTIVYVNYPDSTAGKGYSLLPKYETKATAYDLLATELEGKTVRRQIIRDDKLYVLALDAANEPYIYLADLAASTVTELDKAAVVLSDNGRLKLSDIALTADHVLVASGTSKNHYSNTQATEDGEARGITNFYKWTQNEETGLPETCQLWFNSNFSGNYYRAVTGKTITYTGTLENGTLVVTSVNLGNTKGQSRLGMYAIAEGELSGTPARWDLTYSLLMPQVTDKEDYELMVSPRDKNNFVIDGNVTGPIEFSGPATAPTLLGTQSLASTAAVGANYFKYADKDLMVAPKIDEEGKVAGLQLFDVTNGFDSASEVVVEYTFDPVDYTYASAHGELALTLSADDHTTGATIELFLAVDGKVTKFTVGDFYTTNSLTRGTITGVANPFAYALKGSVVDGVLNVAYSLNEAAADVNIHITNESEEIVYTHAVGAQDAGDYTAIVELPMDLAVGVYNWSIEVAGTEADNIQRFKAERFYHPSGLDVDNSFESASFGTLFVAEGYTAGNTTTYVSAQADGSEGGGLYMFKANGEQILNKDGGARFYTNEFTCAGNGSDFKSGNSYYGADFARVRVAEDGRIFVNRYVWEGNYFLSAASVDALVAGEGFTNLLAGKTMTDMLYYDESGNLLAGPAQDFDVIGSGEDTKLLAITRTGTGLSNVFSENSALEYNIGAAMELPSPSIYTPLNNKYTISYTRAINIEYDNLGGVWYCQYRGTPSNSQPALIYVDANGEIKYFEGEGGKSRRNGAMSVSPDGTRLVAATAQGVLSVYNILRADDGSVHLDEVCRLTHNMGNNLYDLAWGPADNFYASNASGEYVDGYSVPRTEPFATKAASKYSFEVTENGLVGVEGVEVDANAPVKYYNLQGIEVDGDNLSNGIYIKVQGNKSTKIYVK